MKIYKISYALNDSNNGSNIMDAMDNLMLAGWEVANRLSPEDFVRKGWDVAFRIAKNIRNDSPVNHRNTAIKELKDAAEALLNDARKKGNRVDGLSNALSQLNMLSIRSQSSSNALIKTAVADGEFRDWKDRVNKTKDEVTSLKKDNKDLEKRVKELEKTIEKLNIGSRRFWEQQNTFTSLERKLERADAVVQEWNNYKKEMKDEIKNMVEKHTKARIKDIAPQAY